MTMSDRICLMNEARIEQVSAPADLYFSPRSVFAAGFLGESNTLEGVVEAIEGETALVRHAGAVLRGRLMNGARVGARCRLMVRPEALAISDELPSAHGNVIHANVTSHVIGGAIARTVVRASNGVELVATRLTSRSGARPQGNVRVSFAPEDSLIFGEES